MENLVVINNDQLIKKIDTKQKIWNFKLKENGRKLRELQRMEKKLLREREDKDNNITYVDFRLERNKRKQEGIIEEGYYSLAEDISKTVMEDKVLGKVVPIFLATIGYVESPYFDSNMSMQCANGFKGIDALGKKLLTMVQDIAKWVVIIMFVIEAIKSLLSSDFKSVGKAVVKFALIYASLFFFPMLCDEIRQAFM